MEKQFNNQLRKVICSLMNRFIKDKKVTLSPNFAAELASVKIQAMIKGNNNEEVVNGLFLATIAFIDGYKKLNQKLIQNNLTNFETKLYNDMDNLNNLEEFLNMDKFFDYLPYLLEASYEFEQINGLGKISLQRSLQPEQNDYLNSLTFLNQEDIKKYDKKLKGEDYVRFFNNMFEHLNLITPNIDEEIIGANIVDMIVDFLISLSTINFEDFKENIEEMMKFYYEWAMVIVNNPRFEKSDSLEPCKQFIRIYHTFNQEESLYKIPFDRMFLINLVDSYVAFTACQYDDTTYCYDNVLVKKKELDMQLDKNENN